MCALGGEREKKKISYTVAIAFHISTDLCHTVHTGDTLCECTDSRQQFWTLKKFLSKPVGTNSM